MNMNERLEEQFDELMADHLDGGLPEDAARIQLDRFVSLLRDTPSLRARFAAQAEIAGLLDAHFANTRDDAALIERTMVSLPEKPNIAGADQTSAKVMGAISVPPPLGVASASRARRRLRWGLPAAAAIIVAAIFGWRYLARNGPAMASIAMLHSSGEVYILSNMTYETQRHRASSNDEPLYSIDAVQLGKDGSATITYFDGTSVTLDGGATIWLSLLKSNHAGETVRKHTASLGKQLVLEHNTPGTLKINASKQPAGAPMHIYTDDLDVEIIGTRLVVGAYTFGKTASFVGVFEGRVKVTQLSDQHSITLNANEVCGRFPPLGTGALPVGMTVVPFD